MCKLQTCQNCKICYIVFAIIVFIFISLISCQSFFSELFSGLIPAIIVALIAWDQLKGIKHTSNGDFLLRLNDEFKDRKIQDVMYLIYIIDRESTLHCLADPKRDLHCQECENVVIQYMKKQLTKIYDSNDEVDIKKRFKISGYLNYLETLAYFVNEGYVSFKDFKNLNGGLIEYHCDLFIDWINISRKNDTDAYSELLKLSKRLEDSK